MRLLPASIAGRTTMVLIAGVVVLLLATSLVSWLAARGEPGPPRPLRQAERIVILATLLDRTAPEARPALVAAMNGPDLHLGWSPRLATSAALAPGWQGGRLEHHLGHALAEHGLGPVVVGRDPAPRAGREGDDEPPLLVWIQLRDGSWLRATLAYDRDALPRLLAFLLGLAVFVGGLTLLALWVARWVTAPLGRFAAAATRLGGDVDAPPLDEAGPSEIKDAAHAFNQMQGRIRRFVEDRTLMLAAVSHDLRTPLTRMRLRAEMVEDEEQRGKMQADLDEMEAMIKDTLAFVRAESAGEPRIALDLAALLAAICDDFALAGHDVTLAPSAEVTLLGRATGLKRAFTNLVLNAVLYGARARIALRAEPERAVVTIDDDGPGIPEAELERVFTPFYRLEPSRSRTTGGTGLGLAVARSLLRAHGGDVTLANREEGGLRQTVVLPRAG